MRERFQFETDDRSAELCELIVRRMVELFGISVDEALGRINRDWGGLSLLGDDAIHRHDDDYWAQSIYYGYGVHWWLNPPGLAPRPYPVAMAERFQFETDDRSAELCELIVRRMVDLFGISVDEAIGRMNRDWKGLSFLGDDIIHHNDDDYWAQSIYYGFDVRWWKNPPGLAPRPYP